MRYLTLQKEAGIVANLCVLEQEQGPGNSQGQVFSQLSHSLAVMLGKSLPCSGFVLLLCKIRAPEKMIFLRDPSSDSHWLKEHDSGHCRIWLQWTVTPNPGVLFSFHLKAPNNTIPSLARANRRSHSFRNGSSKEQAILQLN